MKILIGNTQTRDGSRTQTGEDEAAKSPSRGVFWVVDDKLGGSMTADERDSLSEIEACGGVVMLPQDFGKPDFAGWWNGLTEDERDIIKAIPNFDAEKWRLITGIEV